MTNLLFEGVFEFKKVAAIFERYKLGKIDIHDAMMELIMSAQSEEQQPAEHGK
jgi:hypothetical protein